jgi:hypothetical protein
VAHKSAQTNLIVSVEVFLRQARRCLRSDSGDFEIAGTICLRAVRIIGSELAMRL